MKNHETIQIATAVFMLVGGFALAVAGFVVSPLGQIHESVLGIFAECLIYAGSIFGVTIYIRNQYAEMESRRGKKSPIPDPSPAGRGEE